MSARPTTPISTGLSALALLWLEGVLTGSETGVGRMRIGVGAALTGTATRLALGLGEALAADAGLDTATADGALDAEAARMMPQPMGEPGLPSGGVC